MAGFGSEGYWQTESSRKILYWTIAAVAVPTAGAVVWWITEKSFNRFAPYQYHYRPGTITSFLSRILDRHAQRRRGRAPLRIYMDGCFDMMHYGHANALRQAGALGDQLVLGLIPDSEILRCKGPPVMNEAERKTMVESVKWVGEVITGVPYDLTPEFLEELFTKHNIDYVVHGDDPCLLPDGTDAYAHAKKQGRFRMIKRTEGVSSTDIVGRMLMCTRANPSFQAEKRELAKQFSDRTNFESVPVVPEEAEVTSASPEGKGSLESGSNHTTLSRFMPTSRRIVQFSDGIPAPPGARIVYIDGAFDMFHPGHIDILKLARQQGDFLLVGLHTDEDIGERRGKHLPIMDVHERSLSVLACRYINEVIIGAPLIITEDLIKTFNISLVVRGSVSECHHSDKLGLESKRYAYPKSKDIFRSLQSPSSMTTATIIQRIVQNRSAYEERNAKKNKSEAAYYTSKELLHGELPVGSSRRHSSVCHAATLEAPFETVVLQSPTTIRVSTPTLAHLRGLEDVTQHALVMNESMSQLIEALYEQILDLQQQNLELLAQQQEYMAIQRDQLELAEIRLERIQELQHRDRICQDLIAQMQAKLDLMTEGISWTEPVTVEQLEQMAGKGDGPNFMAKMLGDLCNDPATLEMNRKVAVPLAVKLLDSAVDTVQEQAAITLLSLVTIDNEIDEEASIEANRLGAGSLVTDMLNPPPYQKAHASVLPLWIVLTISEMRNRN